jgi:hypothetical protein
MTKIARYIFMKKPVFTGFFLAFNAVLWYNLIKKKRKKRE